MMTAIIEKLADSKPEPLSDAELVQLIRRTAKANNVTETAIREWLGDEIEALRSGDPVELRAFRLAVKSAVQCGTLPRWQR